MLAGAAVAECPCGNPNPDPLFPVIACAKCEVKFHLKCIPNLANHPLCGDNYFIIYCKECTGGDGFYVQRITTKLKEKFLLVLYNLIHKQPERGVALPDGRISFEKTFIVQECLKHFSGPVHDNTGDTPKENSLRATISQGTEITTPGYCAIREHPMPPPLLYIEEKPRKMLGDIDENGELVKAGTERAKFPDLVIPIDEPTPALAPTPKIFKGNQYTKKGETGTPKGSTGTQKASTGKRKPEANGDPDFAPSGKAVKSNNSSVPKTPARPPPAARAHPPAAAIATPLHKSPLSASNTRSSPRDREVHQPSWMKSANNSAKISPALKSASLAKPATTPPVSAPTATAVTSTDTKQVAESPVTAATTTTAAAAVGAKSPVPPPPASNSSPASLSPAAPPAAIRTTSPKTPSHPPTSSSALFAAQPQATPTTSSAAPMPPFIANSRALATYLEERNEQYRRERGDLEERHRQDVQKLVLTLEEQLTQMKIDHELVLTEKDNALRKVQDDFMIQIDELHATIEDLKKAVVAPPPPPPAASSQQANGNTISNEIDGSAMDVDSAPLKLNHLDPKATEEAFAALVRERDESIRLAQEAKALADISVARAVDAASARMKAEERLKVAEKERDMACAVRAKALDDVCRLQKEVNFLRDQVMDNDNEDAESNSSTPLMQAVVQG